MTAKELRSYDPDRALHRALRSHQWQIWMVKKGVTYKREHKRSWWKAELYCQCGVRKFRVTDSVGRNVYTTYVYPTDYRLDVGLSQYDISAALWLLVMERAQASQKEKLKIS